MMLTEIHIKNLRLRTYIGFNEEERTKLQDVVINIKMQYDAREAMQSDEVADACDYKILNKKIIHLVENNRFNLLEKMASDIQKIIARDPLIMRASIEIDKPHALRFADSVSVKYHWKREN